jgi:wyosine [tRNA(Phe)-imidazoG37] synthetase (radical SAM superfamily)
MNKHFPNVHFEITENDKEKTLIFYGAGKYAKINTKYWIEDGFTPVIFADKNPEKYTETIDGIEITSLDDAISRFPDSLIVLGVAPEWVSKTTEYLIEEIGISENVIRYPDKIVYRKGCVCLGNVFNIFSSTSDNDKNAYLKICTMNTYPGDPEKMYTYDIFEKYEHEYYNYLNNLQESKTANCNTCLRRDPNYYLVEFMLKWMSISSTLKNDKCNYNCKDCLVRFPTMKNRKEYREKFPNQFEYTDMIMTYLDNHKRKRDNVKTIEILDGEPLLNPDIIRSINRIKKDKDIPVVILTNGSIKKEEIKEILSTTNTTLLVDISAGTKSVYKSIKCTDKFVDVINNMKYYSNDRNKLFIKYTLFSGVNDNIDEFKTMTELLSGVNMTIEFSIGMVNGICHSVNDERLDILAQMIEHCKNNSIPVTIYGALLQRQELKKIGLENLTYNEKFQ